MTVVIRQLTQPDGGSAGAQVEITLGLLGLISGYTFSGFPHILLVIAIVVVVVKAIQGGRSLEPFGLLPKKVMHWERMRSAGPKRCVTESYNVLMDNQNRR